ncbi:hypothetical protein QFZ74_004548 [Streptomyces sp. V3I7]|nr:hypothetical protein [Streptomyces sp. V3I7]
MAVTGGFCRSWCLRGDRLARLAPDSVPQGPRTGPWRVSVFRLAPPGGGLPSTGTGKGGGALGVEFGAGGAGGADVPG